MSVFLGILSQLGDLVILGSSPIAPPPFPSLPFPLPITSSSPELFKLTLSLDARAAPARLEARPTRRRLGP